LENFIERNQLAACLGRDSGTEIPSDDSSEARSFSAFSSRRRATVSTSIQGLIFVTIADRIAAFYDSGEPLYSDKHVPDPNWIEELFTRSEPHEPDYLVFQHFRDPQSTIIDVGANWGYSAASIWVTGCPCQILSFEPLACYAGHLARIRQKFPAKYDFAPIGLGMAHGELRFVTPVLNGDVLTALTSASEAAHRAHLWRNIEWEMDQRKLALNDVDLRFMVSHANVRPLDDVVSYIASISAIKIDVEGLEADVIAGGPETIQRHRPLILVEGANREAGVVNPLADAGYVFAERHEDRLRLSMRKSMEPNGFFVHRSRVTEYAQSGLLAA
jgi:FkbM family methyltransferase